MPYFDFQGSDYVAACFELQRRNITRTLRKDRKIPCLVRGCGKKPKKGERVYDPSEQLGENNKVNAHVDCVDRVVAENSARGKAKSEDVKSKVLAAISAKAKPAKPFLGTSVPAKDGIPDVDDILKLVKENRAVNSWQAGYDEGYRTAYREIWERLKTELS